MSIEHSERQTRRRLSPEAARENILSACEKILLASGPQDLKLAEVAKVAGVANATVLHHFGSIDGVQAELMERLIRQLVDEVLAISASPGDDVVHVGDGIRALFDAFEARGAARLAAWLVLTGEAPRLTVVRSAVAEVVAARTAKTSMLSPEIMEDFILGCVTFALGAGLFGPSLGELLGKPPERAREVALAVLMARLETALVRS